MHGQIISLPKGFLRDVTSDDVLFINRLFNEPDVDFYYVRQQYHREVTAFTSFMVDSIEQGHGLYDLICNEKGEPVGLISCELTPNSTEKVIWNIGYAVISAARHMGYASNALNGCICALKDFSVKTAYLDISVGNNASESVARKCGFALWDRCGFYDQEHPEIGLRRHWYKSLHPQDERVPYFQKANIAYRNKDYVSAIHIYKHALEHPYANGSKLTDAQIYSNIGMVCSSMGEYVAALHYLKKAVALGLTNSSIQKELEWLKDYIGLK